MISRSALWIAIAAIVVAFAIYAATRGDPRRPGQPSPHAIDQSQKQ